MKTKSFFAALLLLMASVQTVCSQSMKVWQNGVYVNYNAFGVDSVTFSNDYDAHLWVDLGLPSGTLWATCNIGANSPEEFGDYFAWG